MLAKAGLLFLVCLTASQAFAVIQPQPSATITKTTLLSGGQLAGTPELKPPPALYEGAVAAGAAKAAAPFSKIFKLGIVAGCHIAFGAYLAISVGGACPGIASSNPGLQKLIMGGMGLYVHQVL